MRKRVYFYEYECDKCLKKIRQTQMEKKYQLPQGWEPLIDGVDNVVYTYCEACK